MAEKIEQTVGLKSELIAGQGGVFDVVLDGKTLFSKHQVGRFPEDHEILVPLRALLGPRHGSKG